MTVSSTQNIETSRLVSLALLLSRALSLPFSLSPSPALSLSVFAPVSFCFSLYSYLAPLS